MKNPTPQFCRNSTLPQKLLAAFLLTALTGYHALADVVYVTSMTSNCTSTTVCGSGANPAFNSQSQNVYSEDIVASFTSAISVAAGKNWSEPGARFYSNTYSNSSPASGTQR